MKKKEMAVEWQEVNTEQELLIDENITEDSVK